jgi:hypothetical protein
MNRLGLATYSHCVHARAHRIIELFALGSLFKLVLEIGSVRYLSLS